MTLHAYHTLDIRLILLDEIPQSVCSSVVLLSRYDYDLPIAQVPVQGFQRGNVVARHVVVDDPLRMLAQAIDALLPEAVIIVQREKNCRRNAVTAILYLPCAHIRDSAVELHTFKLCNALNT